MIVECLRHTVPGERGDAFVSACERASEPLLASPRCHAFELACCVEDPTRFILRIEWTSADVHLQGFRRSDEFKAFFAHVRPFVEEIDETRHHESLLRRSRAAIPCGPSGTVTVSIDFPGRHDSAPGLETEPRFEAPEDAELAGDRRVDTSDVGGGGRT